MSLQKDYKLKDENKIQRVGSTKSGYWEIIGK
jgi:hypothetical protein